jgi:polysaccharide biosynthesis/export protein
MTMNVLVSMFLALTLAPQAPAAQAPASTSGPSTQTTAPATPAIPADAATPPSAPPRAAPDSYVIGAHDSLQVTVQDDTMGLSNKYPVDEAGMVMFPYLGRIPAGGRTLLQFQEELTRQLAKDYIRNPQVRIDIDQYKSQSIYVFGAVRTPMEIPMQGTLTLVTALAKAGSPTADAGDDVQISHGKNPDARGALPAPDPLDGDVVHVRWKDLTLGRGDIPLHDGDIVFVPTAKHFTITGQVRNPGSYVWEEGMTVDKAIARAGGMTDRGSDRRMKAHRLVNGKLRDVDIDKQSVILPDDVITISQRLL